MIIGCGCHSDDLTKPEFGLLDLPCLELENYLFPGFADQAEVQLPITQKALADYHGKLLLSGPYIDLNPGTPDRRVREVVWSRYRKACDFAVQIGAKEIIFLSTFIPIIRLDFYEEDWVARSTAFWQELIDQVPDELIISLCNTFEGHPDYLARIAQSIGRRNFKLAFDIGHFLVYGEVPLADWLGKIQEYCQTVYVHSNDGKVDSHSPPNCGVLEPGQIHTMVDVLPLKTIYLIKANDKSTISQSIRWLKEAIAEI